MKLQQLTTLTACCWMGAFQLAAAQTVSDPDLGSDELVADEIIVRGDKIQRSLGDATAGTTIISGAEAQRPINTDIDKAVGGQPNVLANEGFSLPSIRGIDSTSGARPGITVGSQPRTPIVVDDVATPAG
ncbi:MAG: hypothetical protein AAGD13_25275, partial [Pseudomonadota bacterium]